MNNAFLTVPCKLYGTGWEGLSSDLSMEGSGPKQERHYSKLTELPACERTHWLYSPADTRPPLSARPLTLIY